MINLKTKARLMIMGGTVELQTHGNASIRSTMLENFTPEDSMGINLVNSVNAPVFVKESRFSGNLEQHLT
jgi:hypothetical protein